jgi:hypothetical protein
MSIEAAVRSRQTDDKEIRRTEGDIPSHTEAEWRRLVTVEQYQVVRVSETE